MRRFLLLIALIALCVWTVQTVCAQTASLSQGSLESTFREGNGIFTPQQTITMDVTLRNATHFRHPSSNVPLSLSSDTPFALHAALVDLSSPYLTIAELNTHILPDVPLPISFVTPLQEGVYGLNLAVTYNGVIFIVDQSNRNRRSQSAIPTPQQVAKAEHQFVVLSTQVSPRHSGNWTLVNTRDPLAIDDLPARQQLLNLPRMGDLPKIGILPPDFPRPRELIPDLPRPADLLGVTPLDRRLQSLFSPASESAFGLTLRRDDAFSEDITHTRIPLHVDVGKPHLVEIDFPVNVPQTFGVAITGDSLFVNTAATIHIVEEIAQDTRSEAIATHQLLFWAEMGHHVLTIISDQTHQEARDAPPAPFRNIRISRVESPRHREDQRLPRLFAGTAQRQRIGHIMGASITGCSLEHILRELNDVPLTWRESYERCSRLIDKLHRGGYDGVTLTVLSRDISLYPTTDDTLNYLEMMLQRFNAEELTLIPAIEFNFPIPRLEHELQQNPSFAAEILLDSQHYNLLHPAVQQAMAKVVFHLVEEFGHHPSFGGVAIVLSPNTYAQLPFAWHPPDDHTFAQFRQAAEHTLGIPFPDEERLRQIMPTHQFLTQKQVERMQFLQSDAVWGTWVRWRAATVSGFYTRLAQQVSAKHHHTPLYLLGGTMLDHPEIQTFCVPTLPRNFTPLHAIQRLGIDLQLLSNAESLHFLRPVRISNDSNYGYDFLNSADTVSLFSKSSAVPGVQFVHRCGSTATGSTITSVGMQSRKRFVRQLAQSDVMMFMDGGVSLPFGQESAQFDLLDTFRRLPPVPFRTLQSQESTQPLTVRFINQADGMVMYIVNDAPFTVEADFFFTADFNSRMTELTGHRMIRSFNRSTQHGTHTWRALLQPYDLLAVRISDANATIESVSVYRPSSVFAHDGALRRKVDGFDRRIQSARDGVRWDGLVNGDFETRAPLLNPATGQAAAVQIVGWQCFGQSLTAHEDTTVVHQGNSSVRLTNSASAVTTFLSQPMTIPATGRLGVSMFVGVPAEAQTLPMSVILTGTHLGNPIQRVVPVGESLMVSLADVPPVNGVRWHRLVVPFERLPTESLEEVRIGVQLLDAGTIWLDDIALYPARFSPNELIELQKMLVVANQRFTEGRVSELLTLLEGHWVQFLFEHVPAAEFQPTALTITPPAARETPPRIASPTFLQRARGFIGL